MTKEQINRAIETALFGGVRYHIKKRGMYYRPNAGGYTYDTRDAWKVSLDEAKKHEYVPKGHPEEHVTIHEAAPRNFTDSLDACQLFLNTMTAEELLDFKQDIGWDHIYDPMCLCQTWLDRKGLWKEEWR